VTNLPYVPVSRARQLPACQDFLHWQQQSSG
jgi:hypothetical protein